MTNTAQNQNCEQLVSRARDSRLEDLRLMLEPTRDDVTLGDDGSLDTVLCCGEEEFRFSDTSSYHDENGELDLDALLDDEFDDIAETLYERFYEYRLAFDYVAPGTFTDQDQAYFRYQISYGGPSEEIRFYVNPDLTMYRAEFWYLDWFDGASRNVTNDPIVRRIWEFFSEIGSVEHAMSETT